MPDGVSSEFSPKGLELSKLHVLSERPEYRDSIIVEKFQKQLENNKFGGRLVSAFTDIDGTFILISQPTDRDRINFAPSVTGVIYKDINDYHKKATWEVVDFLNKHSIPIIAVTGRDLQRVMELEQDGFVPKFDVVAGAVGTEIEVLQKEGTYKRDGKFENYVRESIGFDREVIYPICLDIKEKIRGQMPQIDLVFQERDSETNTRLYKENPMAKKQGKTKLDPPQPYKISFNFNGDLFEMETVKQIFSQEFSDHELGKVRLVFSHAKDMENGVIRFNIDVVPVQKDDAINWMSKEFGCIGAVAGDSGNDEAMIKFGANAGVVVGGSKQELTAIIAEMNESEIRRTEHFGIFRVNDQERLLYIEPSLPRKKSHPKGPESLIKAGRALFLLLKLKQK